VPALIGRGPVGNRVSCLSFWRMLANILRGKDKPRVFTDHVFRPIAKKVYSALIPSDDTSLYIHGEESIAPNALHGPSVPMGIDFWTIFQCWTRTLDLCRMLDY